MEYEFSNKAEMLAKLRAYTKTPDDDNIRFKTKIKQVLLNCPELLYVLHENEYESELFNEDGSLNEEGEWDRYFGELSNIRPYLVIPDVQTEAKSLICYQTSFTEQPRYNAIEKYGLITFNIFVYATDNIDKDTGIPRHDLLASIIREKINWSNVFGTQTQLVSSKESTTDTNYVVRTLVFQCTLPNSIVKTTDGKTGYINKSSLRKGMI